MRAPTAGIESFPIDEKAADVRSGARVRKDNINPIPQYCGSAMDGHVISPPQRVLRWPKVSQYAIRVTSAHLERGWHP